MSVFSGTEPVQRDRPKFGSDKSQRRMTDSCSHFADLAIAPFRESYLEPCSGNAFSVSDWCLSGMDGRLGIEERNSSLLGSSPINRYSCSQPCEGVLNGYAFDLDQIGALVSKSRFQQEMLCRTIVREEKKTLTICVKSPDGVDISRKCRRTGREPRTVCRKGCRNSGCRKVFVPFMVGGLFQNHDGTFANCWVVVVCSRIGDDIA
jgi:hypothetical protein